MSGQLPGSALYDGGWYKVLQDLLTDLQGTNNLPGKQQKLQRWDRCGWWNDVWRGDGTFNDP